MTLEECYDAIGGNYSDVVNRFGKEQLVLKYIYKFLDDESYNLLVQSLDNKDFEEAFRMAHTLKGICQNLSLTRLYDSSSLLTEELRGKCGNNYLFYFNKLKSDYEEIIKIIRKFKKENSD